MPTLLSPGSGAKIGKQSQCRRGGSYVLSARIVVHKASRTHTVINMLRRLIATFALLTAFAVPALAQDAADAIVRLNRLEGQFRQMSGQVEQLQFENRQLKDQLRKFQEDVDFRFQEKSGGSRPAPATSAPAPGRPVSGSAAEAQRRVRPVERAGGAWRSASLGHDSGIAAARHRGGSGPTRFWWCGRGYRRVDRRRRGGTRRAARSEPGWPQSGFRRQFAKRAPAAHEPQRRRHQRGRPAGRI